MIQNPQINKEQWDAVARKFPLGKICTDINRFERSLNASLTKPRICVTSLESLERGGEIEKIYSLVKKFESLGGKLDNLPKPLGPHSIKEIEDFIARNSSN